MKKCSTCNALKPLDAFYPKWNRITNSSKCKECLRAKQKAYRKNNPEKAKEIGLKSSFGMTLTEYNMRFNAQNGCCAICEMHQSKLSRTLSVDHNHNTGEIRGLLCNTCNSGIGLLKEDIKIFRKAIKYLRPANVTDEVDLDGNNVILIQNK